MLCMNTNYESNTLTESFDITIINFSFHALLLRTVISAGGCSYIGHQLSPPPGKPDHRKPSRNSVSGLIGNIPPNKLLAVTAC